MNIFTLLAYSIVIWGLVSQTATDTFSEPKVAKSACYAETVQPYLPNRESLKNYASSIETYLSHGGTASRLRQILTCRKLIDKSSLSSIINPAFVNRGGVESADFNGDGALDVAVSMTVPADRIAGALFIYIREKNSFHLLPEPLSFAIDPYALKPRPKYLDRAPKFIYVGDMNNDGRAEIVADIGEIGPSTIWLDIQILGWHETTQDMQLLKIDQAIYLGDGGLAKVVNTLNGFKKLVLRTGFSGSAIAAGPQRHFTIIYSWNGEVFVETSILGDPSLYRQHVAYDALVALNRSNLKTAAILYNAVLNDPKLKDWDDELKSIIDAHAAYGFLLTRVNQFGINAWQAQKAYDQFHVYAEQSNNHSRYFIYGELFWRTAKKFGDLHVACEAVNTAIQDDIQQLPKDEPHDIWALGLWRSFVYWQPTDRGLSYCPF